MLAGEHQFNPLEMLLMNSVLLEINQVAKLMQCVLLKQSNPVSIECFANFPYASLNTREYSQKH